MLPLALAWVIPFVAWWLRVLGGQYDVLWRRGPPRTQWLQTQVTWSVRRQRTLIGVAIPHVLLVVCPFHGLVGRGSAVDEEDGVNEESPYQRRGEESEKSGSTDTDVSVEAPAPDSKILAEFQILARPDGPQWVLVFYFRRQQVET